MGSSASKYRIDEKIMQRKRKKKEKEELEKHKKIMDKISRPPIEYPEYKEWQIERERLYILTPLGYSMPF